MLTRFPAVPARPLRACPAVPQVFVTAQARCLDLATVYAQGSGALVVVSPGAKGQLARRMEKYIVMDKVGWAEGWAGLGGAGLGRERGREREGGGRGREEGEGGGNWRGGRGHGLEG